MNQNQHNRSQRGSRASLIILIVLAFLLMIAAIVLVINIPDDESWIVTDNPSQSEVTAEIGFISDPVEAQQLYPFADGVFKVSSSRIAFLDFQGLEQYSVDIDMSMPFVKSTAKFFMTYDRDGFSYILFNKDGERFRGILDGRILGAAISSDGDLAVIQDQYNSTGIVSYIEADSGQRLYDCHFPESGHVLSVSFSPFADFFDVVLLNTMSASAEIVLKRFSTDGNPVGQLLPRLNSLFPLLVYNSDQHMILCSSSSVIALNYQDYEPIWQNEYYQIQTVLSGENNILLIAAGRIDGPYSLYAVGADGTETELVAIGEQASGLHRHNDLAAVFWSSRLIVIDTLSGAEIFADELGAEIIRVGFIDDKSLLAVTRTGVMRITLP